MKDYIKIDFPSSITDKYRGLSYEAQQELRISSCAALTNYILNELTRYSWCSAQNLHIYSKPDGSINIIIGQLNRQYGEIKLIQFRVPGYISYMNTLEAEYVVEEIIKYFTDPNNV